MALNTQFSIANPLKAKTIGLTDSLQLAGTSYTALLTVLNTQTLKIEDGSFAIKYAELGGVDPIVVAVYITVSGIRLPVFYKKLAPNERGESLINMKDTINTPITLKTGDTVYIEYIYGPDTGLMVGTGGGNINCMLIINDYQQ